MEERGAGGGAGARVVVLVDMDCFYCQVEQARSPELRGRPLAVVQYNPWLGGGIIAVNYEARARGVTRHMRGDQARAACPDLALVAVPSTRGKADIGRYREAGERVARVLQRCAPLLERASIDEAYLDITAPVQERLKTTNIDTLTKSQMPNTFALGYDSWEEFMRDALYGANECLDFDPENAQALLVGALIVSEIRDAVYKETGYECSAGIAHNKILAKLVCGMNKPNKQTVLPKHSVNILYSSLSLKKVKHLGGKFGDTVCELLRIKTMGELQRFSERELQNKFDEKNGMWLYNIARGIDTEPVQAKFNPKSIGCCKQFKGKAAILHLDSLSKWLKDLGDEIEERLEKDSLQCNRVPKQMVVSFMSQFPDGRDVSSSRSYNFTIEDVICGDLLYSKSFELIMESTESVKPKENEENRKLRMPIKFLGISVGKFEDKSDKKNSKKIVDFFGAGSSKQNETLQHADSNIEESNSLINVKQEKKPSKSKDKTKDKETVFQRFFQSTNKILSSNSNQQIENQVSATSSEVPTNIDNNGDSEIKNNVASQHISSTLDKQESFFQRFLNNGKISPTSLRISDTNISNHKNTADSIINCLSNKDFRPNTPICNIIQCGNEDSNSNYSSSTIDIEINKSISLFEDSPDKSKHIDKMRSLLNASLKIDSGQILNSDDETPDDLELAANNEKIDINSKENEESQPAERSDELICPECKKRIPTEMFTTHSDYHLALKLREEERIECRKHVVDAQKVTDKKASKTVEKLPVLKEAKIQTKSIASFFSKIDDNIPKEICVECGQKVPVDKFSEHLDFHEAQKLSREINNKISPSFKTVNKSAVKRKQTTSPIKKPKKPCASIDSFFR